MDLTIELAVSFLLNAVAIAYGYGILQQRVNNVENDMKHIHDHESEIFNRIREIELITPSLKDAVGRIEKITSNGLSKDVRDIQNRLTVIEQKIKNGQ